MIEEYFGDVTRLLTALLKRTSSQVFLFASCETLRKSYSLEQLAKNDSLSLTSQQGITGSTSTMETQRCIHSQNAPSYMLVRVLNTCFRHCINLLNFFQVNKNDVISPTEFLTLS